MADFDFLDGFDADGDWGFTSVKQKPATESKAESEATKEVVKTTADNVGKAVSSEIINRLESKLDKLLRATNETKETVVAKNETELEIAKKQMDDEYDLRKDNLGKEYKEDFKKLILEYHKPEEPNSGWIHCSYKSPTDNRKQTLRAFRNDQGKTQYVEYNPN